MENVREIVRCDKCNLVQFRTVSGMCRRCDRPLPVVIPHQDIQDQAEPEEGDGTELKEHHPKIEEELFRFRRNIRRIRVMKGLTQANVGQATGLPRSNLARIE